MHHNNDNLINNILIGYVNSIHNTTNFTFSELIFRHTYSKNFLLLQVSYFALPCKN